MNAEKIDAGLQSVMANAPDGSPIDVIVKTVDRLNDEDRATVERLGGHVKADLYIVNAYSASLPKDGITTLSDSPRVVMLYFDSPVHAV